MELVCTAATASALTCELRRDGEVIAELKDHSEYVQSPELNRIFEACFYQKTAKVWTKGMKHLEVDVKQLTLRTGTALLSAARLRRGRKVREFTDGCRIWLANNYRGVTPPPPSGGCCRCVLQ